MWESKKQMLGTMEPSLYMYNVQLRDVPLDFKGGSRKFLLGQVFFPLEPGRESCFFFFFFST